MAGGVTVGVGESMVAAGLALGFAVGAAVGLTVGFVVVCLTVECAGRVAVGIAVGFALSVGAVIGVVEGEAVGVPVGVVDGVPVGMPVGEVSWASASWLLVVGARGAAGPSCCVGVVAADRRRLKRINVDGFLMRCLGRDCQACARQACPRWRATPAARSTALRSTCSSPRIRRLTARPWA
jgi:hypothetical protein